MAEPPPSADLATTSARRSSTVRLRGRPMPWTLDRLPNSDCLESHQQRIQLPISPARRPPDRRLGGRLVEGETHSPRAFRKPAIQPTAPAISFSATSSAPISRPVRAPVRPACPRRTSPLNSFTALSGRRVQPASSFPAQVAPRVVRGVCRRPRQGRRRHRPECAATASSSAAYALGGSTSRHDTDSPSCDAHGSPRRAVGPHAGEYPVAAARPPPRAPPTRAPPVSASYSAERPFGRRRRPNRWPDSQRTVSASWSSPPTVVPHGEGGRTITPRHGTHSFESLLC